MTPQDLKYTADHQWARVESEAVRVGITHHAQDALGDVDYVELPAQGAWFRRGDKLGEVESAKSLSDVFAPMTGTVVQVNESLAETPGLVNDDPYGAGWLTVLEPESLDEAEFLLTAEEYVALTG